MRAEKFRAMAGKLFVGGGELGALLRSHDWSQTQLGAVESWSDDLKAAVQILLTELDRAKPSEKTQRDAQEQKNGSAEAALHQANQLNAFRVKLADALRPLTDASEIQAIAARILGESLGANRVIYIEVVSGGEEVIVHRNYTNGVAELSGRYRLEDYRRNLSQDHQTGRTQIVTDIPNNPSYTDAQKARYREIDIAAHIDVPLIKNNQFVALLAVQQSTPRRWTETEVKLVEETAEQTWAAVERARAEAALRSSEAKYRMLFESIDEGYFIADVIFDADDRPIDVFYLEANPAVKRITGLDLAGRSLREIDPNYESAWWEAYGRVAQTGIAERQELYTEPLDSWFSFYTFKIGDADSRRVGCVFQDITGRKRTEQALRDSEQRYRTLFDSIDEAFCVGELMVDETGEPYDHRVLEVNPAFGIMTGLQQVTGKAASELIPTLEPFWLETYARVVTTGESTRFESYLQGLDGWFDVYVAPLNVFHSQQFAVLFRNITEQKRASLNAQLLATVRDDLTEITEVGDIVQMVGDRLHRYLNISSCAFVEINERADEAEIHHHWHQSHVPNLVGVYSLPQFVAEEFLHTAQAGQPIVVRNVAADPRIVDSQKYAALSIGAELNIPLIRDGEWKFSLAVFHPVPYDWRDDEIALMQELASRIWTKLERARAEAALRDSRTELERQVQKFDATLSTITDCVFRFDRDGRFLYANQVLLDLWGLTATEALGKTMAELNYPEAVERQLLNDMRQVFETGETVRSETAYTSPTGVGSYFENLLSPVLAADGTVESVVGSSRNITDRKQTEETLRESEQRFRLMADAVPQIVWLTDAQGRVEFFNKQWSDYTGVPYEPTTAAEVAASFVHPDDGDRTMEAFNEAQRSGGVFSVEHRIRSATGSYRWFLVRAEPYRNPLTGEIIRWFGASIDIHDRKQAELEIQKFVSLADNSREFIGMCDMNFVPFYVNPAGQQLVGLDDVQQYIETSVRDFFFPEDQDFIINEFLPRVLQEGRAEVEIRFRHFKTGAALWMIYNVFYIRGENNQPIGLATVSRNITDRFQAEEALRESESRLRLALESAELGTWDFNPISGVLRWDDSCKAAFGLPPEAEINYDVFLSGLHPDDRDRTDQLVQFALNSESNGEYDLEYRTIGLEDGVERWIAAKGKAFFNPAGIASRFIGTVLNITEKKRIEAEREHLLQREQAARETAERANRIKDEFLAVLSHELRSPLNPILGWTRLLRSGKLDAVRQREALATIERNAKLQTQLIEDLLDISRIMQGKMSLTITFVSLTFVISAAVETVRLAAEAKNIQLVLDFAPEVALVSGDAARLQQVVWNLLTNAVKFTPNNGQVTVELRQLDRLAQIRVIDTGKGINPQFLPHVFEYFRQEDGSTTRKFGGLGLGLAIARQIVEMHGGIVRAQSQGEGQGATFIVQLPTMKQTPSLVSEPIQTQTDAGLLSGIQILLVDDEPDTREFQAFLLEQNGAHVRAVASGEEALQALEQSIFDVLVSDIGMADMDGYMLLQQIRSHEALRSDSRSPNPGGMIPAIALTAYAAEIDRQQALQVGFQTHITKPVEPSVLVRAILLSLGRA